MKKMLVFGLFLYMVLLPTLCFADEERERFSSGEWEYYVNDSGTLTISQWYGQDDKVLIPNEIDGMTVTEIGDQVFCCCYGLEEVIIPDTIKAIGRGAFESCDSLTSIEIPASVMEIEAGAFEWCGSLSRIQVSPDSANYAAIDNVLFEKTTKTLHTYPCGLDNSEYSIPQGIAKIGEVAFERCTKLMSVEIPDSVTEIGEDAFGECSGLTSIEIPKSVIVIRNDAFESCSGLTSIIIPESVTKIGNSAFAWCNNLVSIDIPKSVMEIGETAFTRCCSLSEIQVSPENEFYAVVDNVLFETKTHKLHTYPCGLYDSEYTVPANIDKIGRSAFFGCSNIESIIIPDSVTEIGAYSFSACDYLTLIVEKNSYAAQYAKENGIPYEYPGSNDWLSD